ncbi:MAG: C40 family peptidase [Sphingomonadaceae bacterium]|nr:C40 family peptidase [Sphingomonadaceae bacterium]
MVGSPFRLHGRDPSTGLDCIGVLAAALEATGRDAPLPRAYSLRSRNIAGLDDIAGKCGFATTSGTPLPGDVLFARVGSCQFHLLLSAKDGQFVHAHAGLKRVVISPMRPGWTIVGHWRLIEKI